MALALATAVALPMLEPVVKQVLLAAWAFGESVMDLRSLMSGKTRCSGKKQQRTGSCRSLP